MRNTSSFFLDEGITPGKYLMLSLHVVYVSVHNEYFDAGTYIDEPGKFLGNTCFDASKMQVKCVPVFFSLNCLSIRTTFPTNITQRCTCNLWLCINQMWTNTADGKALLIPKNSLNCFAEP